MSKLIHAADTSLSLRLTKIDHIAQYLLRNRVDFTHAAHKIPAWNRFVFTTIDKFYDLIKDLQTHLREDGIWINKNAYRKLIYKLTDVIRFYKKDMNMY